MAGRAGGDRVRSRPRRDGEQALGQADHLGDPGFAGPQEKHIFVARVEFRRTGENLPEVIGYAAGDGDLRGGRGGSLVSFADLKLVVGVDDRPVNPAYEPATFALTMEVDF